MCVVLVCGNGLSRDHLSEKHSGLSMFSLQIYQDCMSALMGYALQLRSCVSPRVSFYRSLRFHSYNAHVCSAREERVVPLMMPDQIQFDFIKTMIPLTSSLFFSLPLCSSRLHRFMKPAPMFLDRNFKRLARVSSYLPPFGFKTQGKKGSLVKRPASSGLIRKSREDLFKS